jgi:xylulokinase
VVGGGARSTRWNQIKADVLNVPYQRLKRGEFGAWGSAMIAGKAVGLFDNLAEVAARHAQPDGDPARPQPEHHAIYKPLIEKYIRLQSTLRQMFVELQHG